AGAAAAHSCAGTSPGTASAATAGPGRGVCAVHAVSDDVGRHVRAQRVVELRVQALQVGAVDVGTRLTRGVNILFAAVHGQVGGPAEVHRAAAVVFFRIEDTVAVGVVAVKQLRRHTAHKQQLLDAVEWAVLGLVGRSQTAVVIAFGAVATG